MAKSEFKSAGARGPVGKPGDAGNAGTAGIEGGTAGREGAVGVEGGVGDVGRAAGPNELGRMPVGVLPEGSNLEELQHEQADAADRAGKPAQDRPPSRDSGPIVTDPHSDS